MASFGHLEVYVFRIVVLADCDITECGYRANASYREWIKHERLVNVTSVIPVSYRKKQQLMKVIQNFQPEIKTVHQARVLLVGPIGAGKSSFFNSVNSAFRGNMTSQAITGTAGTSVTTQVPTQILFSVIVRSESEGKVVVFCYTEIQVQDYLQKHESSTSSKTVNKMFSWDSQFVHSRNVNAKLCSNSVLLIRN